MAGRRRTEVGTKWPREVRDREKEEAKDKTHSRKSGVDRDGTLGFVGGETVLKHGQRTIR